MNVDLPALAYENALFGSGYALIAGIDEVGRGALAGPLYAAAVILPSPVHLAADLAFWSGVRDSKTLSAHRRAVLAEEIIARCRCWATAAIEAPDVDRLGVAAANRWAMELAVRSLPIVPDLLLIDAMTIDFERPQIGIIDGDAISLSIAAASIVAKVARDTEMVAYEARWPGYGFDAHKGYGTRSHLDAVSRLGVCPIHRRSYAPIRRAAEAEQ